MPKFSVSGALRLYQPGVVRTVVFLFLGGLLFCAPPRLPAQSQNGYYRVFLRDKGPQAFAPGSELYEATLALHNERCKERRAKVRPLSNLFSIEDAPLYRPYLDSIAARGAVFLFGLRWQNYVVVQCDSSTAADIAMADFTIGVRPASAKSFPLDCEPLAHSSDYLSGGIAPLESSACGLFDYGFAATQNLSINAPALHALGISGKGVLIGLLDSGFRWRFHESLRGITVADEYDFVFRDSLTADEAEDQPGQDGHGTLVLSTIAGFAPGALVGVAPRAEFLLAKTEDLRSETHLEEDNYAAALEWMEARGADISSSSLGYFDLDTLQEDYEAGDLDGRSPIATRALNLAAARGMICVTSAGNSGPAPATILVPGDADSAITVASVTNQREVSGFSSRGPVAGSMLKPTIAAQGSGVFVANTNGSDHYSFVNGTSVAAPLISGGIALLLSAYPELAPWQVRRLLTSTASRADKPDSAIGYGIADVYGAALAHDILIAPELSAYIFMNSFRIAAAVEAREGIAAVWLYLRSAGQTGFSRHAMHYSPGSGRYYTDLPRSTAEGNSLECYVYAESTSGRKRRAPLQEGTYFTLPGGNNSIACGINIGGLPQEFPADAVEGLYPNPARRGETATLALASPPGGILELDIFTPEGRRLCAPLRSQAAGGSTFIDLPTGTLAPGLYVLRLLYEGRLKYFPFIIVD